MSVEGKARGRGIIAISGKSGCGNSTVSALLAKRLGWRLVNFTFRNLAAEKGMAFGELLALARSDDSIDRELDARQLELASSADSVLGSRLAVWLVPDAALRVYLNGSVEERARRIWSREGGAFEDVLATTVKRDAEDSERYRRIYGIDSEGADFCDLSINTEAFSPEGEVEIIMEAFALSKKAIGRA